MKRLLPLLLLLLGPLTTGAGGYFAMRALLPAPPPAAEAQKPAPPVRVEGGKIAVQIYRPRRIDTLVTDLSVEVPASEAPALQAPLGQARLRDRALQILLDAAETPAYRQDTPTPELVAGTLAAGLGSAVPGMKGAAVSFAVIQSAPRR